MDDQRVDRESGMFRFSLKALLILAAIIAIGISAYINGQREGYEKGYQTGRTNGVQWARNNPEKK